MGRGAEITVAGAGALGLSAALALADAGCQVTVCDPGGGNASGVAAGMLAPAFEAVLDESVAGHLALLLAARDLWPALSARSGVGLDRSGALAVGSAAWLAQVKAAFIRLGLHAGEAPRSALETLAPGISAAFGSALMTREDWRLEPRAALAALRAAAEAAGVGFRAEPASRRDGDFLVVATGAGQALVGVAPELSRLSPIKGHILRVAAMPAGRMSLRGEGIYVVPAEGGVAVGATMEAGVDDPAVDPLQQAPLQAAGARLMPGLEGAEGALLAGVRAATADGLPMAGFSEADGVILAVGARRNGWLLAPLVAQVVAACVTGADAGPYAQRLDPGRFRTGA